MNVEKIKEQRAKQMICLAQLFETQNELILSEPNRMLVHLKSYYQKAVTEIIAKSEGKENVVLIKEGYNKELEYILQNIRLLIGKATTNRQLSELRECRDFFWDLRTKILDDYNDQERKSLTDFIQIMKESKNVDEAIARSIDIPSFRRMITDKSGKEMLQVLGKIMSHKDDEDFDELLDMFTDAFLQAVKEDELADKYRTVLDKHEDVKEQKITIDDDKTRELHGAYVYGNPQEISKMGREALIVEDSMHLDEERSILIQNVIGAVMKHCIEVESDRCILNLSAENAHRLDELLHGLESGNFPIWFQNVVVNEMIKRYDGITQDDVVFAGKIGGLMLNPSAAEIIYRKEKEKQHNG